ncbi:MAG TPA: MBL fold metallo-hydrolase [Nitrospira sp.]|nr:MBL fold metallo-hydrolase [Nitrospira sp.]
MPIDDPFSSAASNDIVSPNKLKILICDVGQGDSTIVVSPTGRTLLIDAGPSGSGTSSVLPILENRQIDRLDWIVLSHYDADHIGGLSEILLGQDGLEGTEDDYFPSRSFLDRGTATSKNTPAYFQYLASSEKEGRREAVAGEVIDLGGGATAEIIVVNGRFTDGKVIHLNPDEENEASIGILIRYGDFSYFTAGDLTGGAAPGGYETKDLETHVGDIIGDIDILHAGHHGSASSSNSSFLESTHPEAVIISVGRENDYGHPSSEVLERLDAIGTSVYRTDLLGHLEVVTDGDEIEIQPLE